IVRPNRKQIEHALFLLHNHSYKEVEEKMGISKSTLIRAKRLFKKENAKEITMSSKSKKLPC
ncbi:TPA: recombinase family protein, partial [Bacillus cereus]|nr:recombinase family protein [Bacillus cereus]